MQKHKYYRSEKILGQLYRAVDEEKIWNDHIKITVDTSGPTIWQEFLGLAQADVLETTGFTIDTDRYLEQAVGIRDL